MRASNTAWTTFENNIARRCNSNMDCNYCNAGVQYGFSCRMGGLYIHYNNQDMYKDVGAYTVDSVLRVELNGGTIRWTRDGTEVHSVTETVDYPQKIFATIYLTKTTNPKTLSDVKLTVPPTNMPLMSLGSCPAPDDGGWNVVFELEDDDSKDDIPTDGNAVLSALGTGRGFKADNAFFIGRDPLNAMAQEIAVLQCCY